MEGKGAVIGKRAPDFTLANQDGQAVNLGDVLKAGPVMLAFYPFDFGMVCTKQLCNYQENLKAFTSLGIQVLGISRNDPASHKKFRDSYQITFPLLSDPKGHVARAFGCTSYLLLGRLARAVFILNDKGLTLYRYVEPTPLTRRDSAELVQVVEELKAQKLV